MTPVHIALLILGGIALLGVTAYIVQSIETQRRQRQMRLLQLRDQIRRADHLFCSLPAFFVTPDIRALLLKYMEQRWQQVAELEPNGQAQQQLARIAEQAAEPFNPGAYPSGQLTQSQDRDSARRARALMRELAQFLADLQKQGLFGTEALKQMLSTVKQGYTRLTIELELMDAQETERVSGPAVALHQYRSCLMRLQSFNGTHQIDAQIFELNQRIAQCQAAADKLKAECEEALRQQDDAEREAARQDRLL